MHPDKILNIQNLSSEDRYGYFIRKVADSEVVWLIQNNDQYVTLGDKEEQIAIPVWPEKEFAEMMLRDEWATCTVDNIEVHEFIDWLDTLNEKSYKVVGFPSIDLKGVVVTADEMKNHLIHEIQQFE